MVFRLRPQSSVQIGLFPEHWNTWPWIAERMSAWQHSHPTEGIASDPPRVLHLFAYTGATTLALAKMGAHVTHVDAMSSAVQWGRENANLSGLESRPVRWIVDDVRKYVARELRRGQAYDLIVLDPPSYGHGTKGQAWEIHRDLVPLVEECWQLLSEGAIGMVLTGHSPDVSFKELKMVLEEVDGSTGSVQYQTQQAGLLDRSGRMLDCGYVAKFVRAGTRMRLE
jgi:23S rRNA (cytosine1962-C5)-methyltransferase